MPVRKDNYGMRYSQIFKSGTGRKKLLVTLHLEECSISNSTRGDFVRSHNAILFKNDINTRLLQTRCFVRMHLLLQSLQF